MMLSLMHTRTICITIIPMNFGIMKMQKIITINISVIEEVECDDFVFLQTSSYI